MLIRMEIGDDGMFHLDCCVPPHALEADNSGLRVAHEGLTICYDYPARLDAPQPFTDPNLFTGARWSSKFNVSK